MSKQLLKATSLTGLMTFCSRVLGYVRDMVIAHQFGASPQMDAFLIAFKIPNFMRRLFAEGAFSQAFVPVLSEYRAQKSGSETYQFTSAVLGSLTLILLGVTFLGIVGSNVFVRLFAPGFLNDGLRFISASQMLKITFPYLCLISITAFLSGILNTYDRFAVAALTPIFLNISMILAVIVLSHHFEQPVFALAWGVVIGGVAQVLFPAYFLNRLHLLPYPRFDWSDPGVRKILTLMVPALLGVSVNQLNLIIDASFASYLASGSVTWLYYADRLMEFPLGVFGVAIATVVLPRLSRQFAEAQVRQFSATLDWGLKWVILIGTPSALGLGFLSEPLLMTLFQSGHFSRHDVYKSGLSLKCYALGVLGFMLVKVLGSAFYARQDIKTPVRFAMITIVAHFVLNCILVNYYAHAGLALATSLASLLNAGLLLRYLIKQKAYLGHNWPVYLLRVALACSTLSALIFFCNPPLEQWLLWGRLSRLMQLFKLIAFGVAVYLATLWASGLRTRHLLVTKTA